MPIKLYLQNGSGARFDQALWWKPLSGHDPASEAFSILLIFLSADGSPGPGVLPQPTPQPWTLQSHPAIGPWLHGHCHSEAREV